METTLALQGETIALGAAQVANISFVSSLKSLTAAWLASPFGMATITIAGITGIGKGLKYLSETGNRFKQQAQDAVQAYADLNSELDSLNGQLKDNIKHYNELKSLDPNTPNRDKEISDLEIINKQLELEIANKEKLKLDAQKDAENKAVKSYNHGNNGFTDVERMQMALQRVKELRQEMLSLGSDEDSQIRAVEIKEELSEYDTIITQIGSDLLSTQKNITGITEEGAKLKPEIDAAVSSYAEFIDIVSNNSNLPNIFKALNTSDLQKSIEDINALTSSMGAVYKEQYDNGEISSATLSKLMAENQNWIDLITIENGVIKLNSEAVIESTKAKIQAKIEEVKANNNAATAQWEASIAQLISLKSVVEGYKTATNAALTYAEVVGKSNKVVELENSIKTLDVGIAKNKATIDALKGSLDRLDTNDPFGNLADSIKKANDEARKLQDNLLKAQGDAYLNVIDKRIEKLEEEKDAESKYYDKKIQQLQDEKAALNEVAEEEDKLLAIKKAKENWENLQNQKTRLIYKDGVGWERGVDQSKVDEAKEEYDRLQKEYNKYQLNKEIDEKIKKYEEAKKAALASLDKEIEGWKDLKSQISEQMSHIGETLDEHELEMKLLADAEKLNFSQMSDAASKWADAVEEAVSRNNAAINSAKRPSGGGGGGGSSGSSGGESSKRDEIQDKIDKLKDDKSKSTSYSQVVGISNEIAKLEKELNKLPHYKTGTLSAKSGLSVVDESLKKELLIRQSKGRLTHMEYGDAVFPADLTKNLLNWASSTPNMLMQDMQSRIMKSIGAVQNGLTFQNRSTPILCTFTGDLSFQNIRSGDDAQKFVQELQRISLDAVQHVASSQFKSKFEQ
ncbi:MAG: hypothetical protein RSF40_08885 [Oscillospiraceae bacterium]